MWVRGPNVMLGYWQRPEATQAALVDGWYRSGDAAYADGDGYLYMVDRLKDMIISGGENVYSVEVESALVEHPSVLEAAVFGVPDARWGEAVHAVAVVAEGEDVPVDDLSPTAAGASPASRFRARSSCAPRRSPSPGPARSSSASCAIPIGAGMSDASTNVSAAMHSEEALTDTPKTYAREPPDAHPPLDYPPYKSTALRHPKQPLVYLPHTITEITGPQLLPGSADRRARHATSRASTRASRSASGSSSAAACSTPRASRCATRSSRSGRPTPPGATRTAATAGQRRSTRTSAAPGAA